MFPTEKTGLIFVYILNTIRMRKLKLYSNQKYPLKIVLQVKSKVPHFEGSSGGMKVGAMEKKFEALCADRFNTSTIF